MIISIFTLNITNERHLQFISSPLFENNSLGLIYLKGENIIYDIFDLLQTKCFLFGLSLLDHIKSCNVDKLICLGQTSQENNADPDQMPQCSI